MSGAVDRELMFPWSDGSARLQDPTYGRIDRDIQWWVHDCGPMSLGQRAATESNMQARRDRGLTVLGVEVTRRAPAVEPVRHRRRRRALPVAWRWALVISGFVALTAVGYWWAVSS